MQEVFFLRSQYAGYYATCFDEDLIIPWRLLTLQESFDYQESFLRKIYPEAFLETEIFNKCVLDEGAKIHLNDYPAGIVTTVVQNILQMSEPITNPNDPRLGHALNMKRIEISGLIYQFANLISTAFPSYKLNDILVLNYPDLLKLVAQAEKKLLETGLLNSPLPYGLPNEEQPIQQEAPKQKVDTKQLLNKYLEQQGVDVQRDPESLVNNYEASNQHLPGYYDDDGFYYPQIPKQAPSKLVIDKREMSQPPTFDISGMTPADRIAAAHKVKALATEGMEHIYPEYYQQMKESGKINIKDVPTRHKEAAERIKQNEIIVNKELLAMQKQQDAYDKMLDEKYFKKKVSKKAKKKYRGG